MTRTLLIAALVGPFAAGCGDDAGKEEKPAAKPAAAAPAPASDRVVSTAGVQSAGVSPGKAAVDPAKEAVLAEVRKRGFRNEDFVESDTNRDPFRSFLTEFSGALQKQIQHKLFMSKYALDELKLVAIIGPPSPDFRAAGAPPVPSPLWRAMFVEPTGIGVTVERGDYISKADARITRIAGDRVYVELKEDLGVGKTRIVERVIELHAGEQLPEVGQ